MELKTLNTRIQQLGKKTAKWRDEVQLVLVGCAYQAIEGNNGNGNADPFTQLVKVLDGADMRAVIKWAETNAGVIWQKREETFRINKASRGAIEYDAITLMSAKWYDMARKAKDVDRAEWDTCEFVGKLDLYIAAAVKKMAKHDATIAGAIERTHNLMRAEMGKVGIVIEDSKPSNATTH